MALRQQWITNWFFALGENAACLSDGRQVSLPHTWSIEEEGQHITGTGWYRTTLPAGTHHSEERVFLRFHGAFQETEVFVSGQQMGRHAGSGYTPFTLEITSALDENRETEIIVRVDNRFSDSALPYDRSFDWANDGGLYRPVELWITGPSAIDALSITAQPVLLPDGQRQSGGEAAFGFRGGLSGSLSGTEIGWTLFRGATDSMMPCQTVPVASGVLPGEKEFSLSPFMLREIVFWHFDRPELYTLRMTLRLPDGSISDQREWVIGFRSLKVQGSELLMNGESVRLPGMEWMPGSDPDFGAAEPPEQLEKMLRLLKESNTVITRFHWQQDDWVYDWCDRHGILIQEEIPFWGKQPEGDADVLFPIVCQQLEEMIAAHGHHPSIIAWGVGNELSGQAWQVQRYVRRAAAYVRSRDASRLVNYVSNTALNGPAHDATGDGDILMINDYIGTWHQGFEQHAAWQSLLDAHPGRAFIPSEFGLCEPAFSGGDPRRAEIFLEKMACYRSIPQIVGTVYFCLNDYRTHMGEEGTGRLKRRVHGSADLSGNPKPSYAIVRKEYAPLCAEDTPEGLRFTCRQDIPCYSVCGYFLDNGTERIPIPDLRPGESWLYTGPLSGSFSVYRPTGDPVLFLQQGCPLTGAPQNDL